MIMRKALFFILTTSLVTCNASIKSWPETASTTINEFKSTTMGKALASGIAACSDSAKSLSETALHGLENSTVGKALATSFTNFNASGVSMDGLKTTRTGKAVATGLMIGNAWVQSWSDKIKNTLKATGIGALGLVSSLKLTGTRKTVLIVGGILGAHHFHKKAITGNIEHFYQKEKVQATLKQTAAEEKWRLENQAARWFEYFGSTWAPTFTLHPESKPINHTKLKQKAQRTYEQKLDKRWNKNEKLNNFGNPW